MALTHTLRGGMATTAASPHAGLFQGYIAAFRKWRDRKAAIAELHAMEDRALQDIGISRSEIESVIYFEGRDPTRLRRG